MKQTALSMIDRLVVGMRNGAFPDAELACTDGASINNRNAYIGDLERLLNQLKAEATTLVDHRGTWDAATRTWVK